uniref:Uncharacterized protein n=1 Tax=Anguilla anguilla TaxID=7936 RepID=A0A0E9R1I3_ANGAN
MGTNSICYSNSMCNCDSHTGFTLGLF